MGSFYEWVTSEKKSYGCKSRHPRPIGQAQCHPRQPIHLESARYIGILEYINVIQLAIYFRIKIKAQNHGLPTWIGKLIDYECNAGSNPARGAQLFHIMEQPLILCMGKYKKIALRDFNSWHSFPVSCGLSLGPWKTGQQGHSVLLQAQLRLLSQRISANLSQEDFLPPQRPL